MSHLQVLQHRLLLLSTSRRAFSTRSRLSNTSSGNDWRKNLQQLSETRATALKKRTDAIISRASTEFSALGARINEVTGYHEIDVLKAAVNDREQEIHALRIEAREAKKAYELAVAERSTCQRQVNDLLQRKSSWSDADVLQFTSLVRQDHEYEQAEARAKSRSSSADRRLETQFNELLRAILARYHEEQIWSDKIRSISTYGSLGALALNMVVFILAIVVVEPWKRKRLGETFEQRMIVLEKENQAMIREAMGKIEGNFGEQQEVLSRLAAITTLTPVDHSPPPPLPSPSPSAASDDTGSDQPPPPSPYTPASLYQAMLSQELRDARVLSALVGGVGGALLTWLSMR